LVVEVILDTDVIVDYLKRKPDRSDSPLLS
jgi:hypothetical protein